MTIGRFGKALTAHTGTAIRKKPMSLLCWFVFFSATAFLSSVTLATASFNGPAQETEKKAAQLHWDPPQVDAPLPSLSTTPACYLHAVLKLAGGRAAGMVNNLQNFDAQEHLRFEQFDDLGMSRVFIAENFEYLVDFGEQSGPLKLLETRKPLKGSDDSHLAAIVDKGLPAMALIFYPDLQGDYEMHCEGLGQWNNQPAWVVHFRQVDGMRPRTVSMGNAVQAFPVSLKGRAWISPDSGQVMHLETNLVKGIPLLDLRANAISIDYAPVEFKSQKAEIWLPKFAIAYTDYGKRRTIIEHTFSDFQLFSVQTEQDIQKVKPPQ
jgi:hypothetical protein